MIAMYAFGVVPLIDRLRVVLKVLQAFYTDDASAGERLAALRKFWDMLVEVGPIYEYYPKALKTFLVVKVEVYAEAVETFCRSGVQITQAGRGVSVCIWLGADIGGCGGVA